MRIPRKVKVGAIPYKVQFKREVRDGSRRLAALADHMRQVIEIDNRYPQDQQEDSFLHEMLHCLSDVFHADLTETQICILTPALHAFLKDNKLLKE
jgi:hypothetical protein